MHSDDLFFRFGKNWLTLKTGMNRLKMEDALFLEFSKSAMVRNENVCVLHAHLIIANEQMHKSFHSHSSSWEKVRSTWHVLKVFHLFLSFSFCDLIQVAILNEEDIPHLLLATLQFKQELHTTQQDILLRVQNVVNDDGVRDISRETRKCIFPNEPFDSKYKYYSFSTCVTECLKRTQLRACNCTHFNLIYDGLYLNNFIINNISTR